MTGPRRTRRSGGGPVAATNDEHVRATPETPRVRVLSAEERRAFVDDINARMAQLERQWERSGHTDVHALRGALIFLETQLPPWVFSGVMQQLKVQEMQPPYHEIRWLMVRQGYDEGLVSDDAYDKRRRQGFVDGRFKLNDRWARLRALRESKASRRVTHFCNRSMRRRFCPTVRIGDLGLGGGTERRAMGFLE